MAFWFDKARPGFALIAFVVFVGASSQSQTPSATSAPPPLENTYWKLTQLGSKPVVPRSPAANLTLASASKHASGFSGCNRFTGGYKLDGKQLNFEKIAATRMACAQGQEAEQEFLDALEHARSWRISKTTLELLSESGISLARFEASTAP